MKKWLVGVLTAVMAVSLAACTPTTEKQKQQTKETASASAEKAEDIVPQSTGSAEDKVPDPNVMPVAVISIYHKGDSDGLVQDMDSLDSESLDAQLLVDKMTEYGIFTEGTTVISFDIQDAVGTLDLNQAESGEGSSDEMLLTEIGNTFTENFELDQLKLTVNGENFAGDTIQQGDGDYLEYNAEYEFVE